MKIRPNILQITTHDSGRHFGCYNHPTLQTPEIDELAADGVRLTNYFCASPICCASRASQLTGLYPQTHGQMDLCFPPFNWRLKDEVLHLSQRLKAAGYRTVLCGVQHEVDDCDIGRLAFDSTRLTKHEPADQVADGVAQFLREEAVGCAPFYLQVGLFETHTPFNFWGVDPDTSRGVEIPPYVADTPAARQAMAGYQGAVRKADAALAVIMTALRASGQEENTIVVFTTDHGIEMPRSKWFLYDPGIAIGLIIRYPGAGLTGGRICDGLLSNVDYVPTILELAGIEASADLQGLSFAAGLYRDPPKVGHEAIFAMHHRTQGRCIRTDRFKLIRHFDPVTDFASRPVIYEDMMGRQGIPLVQLYDLQADPNEFVNIAGRPDVAAAQQHLETLLWTWMESVKDPLLGGPIPSPSYLEAAGDYKFWKSQTLASRRRNDDNSQISMPAN